MCTSFLLSFCAPQDEHISYGVRLEAAPSFNFFQQSHAESIAVSIGKWGDANHASSHVGTYLINEPLVCQDLCKLHKHERSRSGCHSRAAVSYKRV